MTRTARRAALLSPSVALLCTAAAATASFQLATAVTAATVAVALALTAPGKRVTRTTPPLGACAAAVSVWTAAAAGWPDPAAPTPVWGIAIMGALAALAGQIAALTVHRPWRITLFSSRAGLHVTVTRPGRQYSASVLVDAYRRVRAVTPNGTQHCGILPGPQPADPRPVLWVARDMILEATGHRPDVRTGGTHRHLVAFPAWCAVVATAAVAAATQPPWPNLLAAAVWAWLAASTVAHAALLSPEKAPEKSLTQAGVLLAEALAEAAIATLRHSRALPGLLSTTAWTDKRVASQAEHGTKA